MNFITSFTYILALLFAASEIVADEENTSYVRNGGGFIRGLKSDKSTKASKSKSSKAKAKAKFKSS